MDTILLEKGSENYTLLENYLGLITNLSKEFKLKLIEELNTDLARKTTSNNDWIDKLYGAFVSDKSAEETIDEIHASRRFTREVYTI
jgi:hypothetical protein